MTTNTPLTDDQVIELAQEHLAYSNDGCEVFLMEKYIFEFARAIEALVLAQSAQASIRDATLEEGHNFGKPLGYAVVLISDNTKQNGMLNGGAHTFKKEALEVCNSKEYAGRHRVIELWPKAQQTAIRDIESAAETLSICMDYPWEHMPEEGRQNMRNSARRIIDAAIKGKAE